MPQEQGRGDRDLVERKLMTRLDELIKIIGYDARKWVPETRHRIKNALERNEPLGQHVMGPLSGRLTPELTRIVENHNKQAGRTKSRTRGVFAGSGA